MRSLATRAALPPPAQWRSNRHHRRHRRHRCRYRHRRHRHRCHRRRYRRHRRRHRRHRRRRRRHRDFSDHSDACAADVGLARPHYVTHVTSGADARVLNVTHVRNVRPWQRGSHMLAETDNGFLVISLHSLRQACLRHRTLQRRGPYRR